MAKPYDLGDLFRIFSQSIVMWHTLRDQCGIQTGLDYVSEYCAVHGACNILELSLRAGEYAKTLMHLYYSFADQIYLNNYQSFVAAGKDLGQMIKIVWGIEQTSSLFQTSE